MTFLKRSGMNFVSASLVSYMWLSTSKTGKSSERDGIVGPPSRSDVAVRYPTLRPVPGKGPVPTSEDGAALLERRDPIPVVAEVHEDHLGVLTVLGGPLGGEGLLVELGRAGDELHLLPVAGGHRRQVAVGDHRLVVVQLVERLVRRPHTVEALERLGHVGQRHPPEPLVEARHALLRVLR